MLTLLLSLAAIGVAPLLDRPLRRSATLGSGADAFAAVAVLGTVLLHVLPHGVEALGVWALLAAAAGLALPSICDLGGVRILGLAAVAGLGAHALVDGAMLAAPEESDAGHALSWAVVIHTVPLSLAVWRAASAQGGALAVVLLGYTALCELLGWVGAQALLDASGALLGLLQCFTAGTLLHFVWAPAPQSRRGSGVGALLGLLAIVAMNRAWPLHRLDLDELEAEATMLGLALTLAPALGVGAIALTALGARERGWVAALRAVADAEVGRVLLGLGLAGVLEGLVPAGALEGSSPWLMVPLCVALAPLAGLGLVGTLPVVFVLEHKGLGPGAAAAALVAGSLFNLSVIRRLREGRGAPTVLPRALSTAALALVAGLLAERFGIPLPLLHDLVETAGGPLAWASLALLVLLGADAVLRGGLPVLMGPLARPHAHGGDGHGHGHDHDHGHAAG